jgi:hypothetical protein
VRASAQTAWRYGIALLWLRRAVSRALDKVREFALPALAITTVVSALLQGRAALRHGVGTLTPVRSPAFLLGWHLNGRPGAACH